MRDFCHLNALACYLLCRKLDARVDTDIPAKSGADTGDDLTQEAFENAAQDPI